MLYHRRHAVLIVAAAVIAAGFGVPRADAAHAAGAGARSAKASPSCWSSLSYPSHVGSDVVASVTWQCTEITQRMNPLISVTSPNGTRTNSSTQCYNTNTCSVSVSTPWLSEGDHNWTSRADYLFVIDAGGSSSYHFGGSFTAYLP